MMEKYLERLNPRHIAMAVGLAVGAATLSSCTNYSGVGNEFVIEGQVTDPGKQSLGVTVTEIDRADGEAGGWFEVGHQHRIHDNCDCHGTWTSRKQYGTIYDRDGSALSPLEVPVGSCVVVEGKIRSDSDGKTSHERPVFDTARIIPCTK